ncbi:hypothetical protein QWY93_14735 [Echinicola jeungdonensis]|uniref:CHRD domain-containing protein n=1 Tax=Echinicola jeungdonensis TaxID=709343 RepID=A0ABV5J317_9BACT|nr:hypothetical protein [Echinicola jeungdonensis]MDN3670576.1 hypothetical protein [Echinicola jeungdonensis]
MNILMLPMEFRKLILIPLIILFSSCEKWEESIYTGNELEYDLTTVSAGYNYTGKAVIKEMSNGRLELTITLEGEPENRNYSFPVHLHSGPYGEVGAEIFQKLNPIDIRTLKSVTILSIELDFEKMENSFDGHIKVHLASEGPDYDVILVAGNVGKNALN